MDTDHRKRDKEISGSFTKGAIALVFLIVGYQAALFVHKVTLTGLAVMEASPDTVYVVEKVADTSPACRDTIRRPGRGTEKLRPVREAIAPKGRVVETFRFDPNTVSVEDLQRLGFSGRQAVSIDNYRRKGGRFRRKEDFARSFVVSDSVFERLKGYIDIPLIDINSADSAALTALPGVGPYLAGKIVEYRERLRGYSFPEQLMDIYRLDSERFDGLKDLVTVGRVRPYPIWTLPEDSLAMHPYIGRHTARSIVLYRENHAPSECSLDGLVAAGLIRKEYAGRFVRIAVVSP